MSFFAYLWLFLWIWFGSAVAAGVIGYTRQAGVAGLVLGLFLGPIGVAAAYALDGRAACPHCAGRLDGRGRICQHCQRPIRWDNAPNDSSSFSFSWLRFRPESLSCPHCMALLRNQPADCPKCGGSITWAKGLPMKVSRHDEAEVPSGRMTDQPWSQARR